MHDVTLNKLFHKASKMTVIMATATATATAAATAAAKINMILIAINLIRIEMKTNRLN